MDMGELRQRTLIQSGMAGDDMTEAEWEVFDAEAERVDKKIHWGRGADFGASVTVVWDDGHEDHGYLTTLPGFTEPDTEGVVHVPHISEDMGEGDAVWLTLHDLAALPMIAEVMIGERYTEGSTE